MRNFIILLKFAIEIITKKQTLIEDRFIFTSTLRSPNHGFQPPFQSPFCCWINSRISIHYLIIWTFRIVALKLAFPMKTKWLLRDPGLPLLALNPG